MIQQMLKEIELAYGVTVLHAVEAGSRAWGFASVDSDYDVRFIFKYPDSRYLMYRKPLDCIESVTMKYDFVGWDIYKALHLLEKSNSSLIEHLRSPIVYVNRMPDMPLLRVNLSRLAHHYIGLAESHMKRYWVRENDVSAKKMLYVVRCVLCAYYIFEHIATPPVVFDQLTGVDHELDVITERLLKAKQSECSTIYSNRIRYLTCLDFRNLHHRANQLPNDDEFDCELILEKIRKDERSNYESS